MARSDANAPLYAGIWFGGLVGTGALIVATLTLGAASIPIWGISLAALVVVMRGPVGKAIGQRISGESSSGMPPELQGEMLQELDDLRNRVLELEERVDFSERLLANAKHPAGAERPDA